jgi:hypothetical protein
MLVNHQMLLNIIPQMTNAVTGASVIFAPIMSVFGFALLLLLAGWILSSSNQPSVNPYRQTYFYHVGPNNFSYPCNPAVHHHTSLEHTRPHERIHGHT